MAFILWFYLKLICNILYGFASHTYLLDIVFGDSITKSSLGQCYILQLEITKPASQR